jgi:hypothetical protein
VVEGDHALSVEILHSWLVLRVHPGTTEERKQEIVAQWYRESTENGSPALIARWAPVIGVTVERFYMQQVKTKRGGVIITLKRFASTLNWPKSPRSASNTSWSMKWRIYWNQLTTPASSP